MSKKRDPVVAVLTYFETAELLLATQALALAQATVRRRMVATQPPAKKKAALVTPARRPAEEVG